MNIASSYSYLFLVSSSGGARERHDGGAQEDDYVEGRAEAEELREEAYDGRPREKACVPEGRDGG